MMDLMSEAPGSSFRNHGTFWLAALAIVVLSLLTAGLIYLTFGVSAAAFLLVSVIGAAFALGIR
jgi:hypothetical protein